MVDGGGAWEGSEKRNPNPNNTRRAFRPYLKLRLQGFLFFFLDGALLHALVKEFVDAVFTSCCDSIIVIATGISWSCHCCRVRVHACLLAQSQSSGRENRHMYFDSIIQTTSNFVLTTRDVFYKSRRWPNRTQTAFSCLVLSLSLSLSCLPYPSLTFPAPRSAQPPQES
jgi:hypothetical protein